MKEKLWISIVIFICFFPVMIVTTVEAQEIETKGSIGFTGNPQVVRPEPPPPPCHVVKPPEISPESPSGTLPQTNERYRTVIPFLGACLIFIILLFLKKRNLNTNYNKKGK